MPVCNGEKFVQKAIQSILNQTFFDFEFIIIDDGSTDSTLEIIKSFKDKRIRLIINQKNLGIMKTLNEGLDLAQADLVARMDADDISLKNRLEIQHNYMLKYPKIAACGSSSFTIDENGKIKKINIAKIGWLLRNSFWKPGVLTHPAVILRKSLFGKYNSFVAEDYPMWLKLGKRNQLANVGKILFKYRVHNKNITFTKKDKSRHSCYKNFIRFFNIADLSYEDYMAVRGIDFNLSPSNVWRKRFLIRKNVPYPIILTMFDQLVYFIKYYFQKLKQA